MGILDVFKRRKDEFNTNPDLGMPLQGQPEPGQEFSQNEQPNSFQQDPYASPGFQPYHDPTQQQQPSQQQPFSPEQYGFERVPQNQGGFPRNNQSAAEVTTLKEFELINAKLDSIKSELDSINQRLKRMERINEGSGTPGKHDAWY